MYACNYLSKDVDKEWNYVGMHYVIRSQRITIQTTWLNTRGITRMWCIHHIIPCNLANLACIAIAVYGYVHVAIGYVLPNQARAFDEK